ncbi:MAG TPA: TlpA disulfide reductase family protein [Burkholderiaceae bacterium]|nr:TlpA disulfide reductase family protein [Burkholderiaceae bacterium]
MLSIPLGPLALPVAPVLLLLAALCALWLARRLAGGAHAASAESALWWAVGSGLVAARIGHVALNASAYAAQPAAWIDLRDGGWFWPAGLLVGTLVLAGRAWRQAALRPALLASGVVGLALWGGGQWLTTQWGGDARSAALRALRFEPLAAGTALPLEALANGAPMVVNLWASWCGPCRAELPLLAQAQQAHPDVRFVYVNQGESAETIRAFLGAQGMQLEPVLLDAGRRLGPAVGSRGLPTTLFIDAQGQVVDAHLGLINSAALNAQLTRLKAPAR